jgi:hypothetical protein
MESIKMKLFSLIALSGLAAAVLSGGCITGGSNSGAGLGGGSSNSSLGLFLESVDWGRLVDVTDINGVVVKSDVLINHLLDSDGVNYQLGTNPVNQRETLSILQDASSGEFATLLAAAQLNLQHVTAKKVGAAPPMTMIARNATVRLQFSEHINPATVDFTTVQVFVGDPPQLSFAGRYLIDNDSVSGKGNVIFDPTVSALEAAQEAVPQNSIGFPGSIDTLTSNIAFRIPTIPDPLSGQPNVLTSLSGSRKPTVQNPSTEPFEEYISGRKVLVRAARTGNEVDAYRGFLRDATRPHLLGVQQATISSVTSATAAVADVVYSIDALRCQPMLPKAGDIFEVGGSLLLVTDVLNSANPAAYRVRTSIESSDGSVVTGATDLAARYTTRYTPVDAPVQVCYLDIQPPPSNPSDFPVRNIDPNATVTVRFDEPIDPSSMYSMKSFVIVSPDDKNTNLVNEPYEIQAAWFRQITLDETVGEFVDRQRGYDYRPISGGVDPASEFGGRILFGTIEATDGNRQFTLAPSAGWNDPGPDHAFVVALRGGADGIKDLSGNPVDLSSFVAGNEGQAQLISVAGVATNYKSLCLLGLSLDENGDGLSEWAGQVNLATAGKITGRVPERFTRSADSSSAAMSNRPVGAAVNEPLNPAGAVVMGMYRAHDFGFGYTDPTEYNVTVTGFNWAPASGVVSDESFADISLSLATSEYQPDEYLDPISGNPVYPASGLVFESFDANILGWIDGVDTGVDEVEVFRSNYFTQAVNVYTANGVNYLPWPDFTNNYVWRDTTIPQIYLGGASAPTPGVQYLIDTGELFAWNPGTAPSVALPLLTRFRTFPQSNSLGLNSFTTTAIVPPNLTPPFSPICRIFSAGGQDSNNQWAQVQPDNPTKGGTRPTGGYLAGGARTPTVSDELIYWAQADFALDTSRMYTHWFDLGATLTAGNSLAVVVEPPAANQPLGTSLKIEFRGAAAVGHFGDPGLNPSPLTSADTPFDNYGDSNGVGSVSAPSVWTTNFSNLEDLGFRYFQIRVTFKSNADLGLRPSLDGLGIVWTN